LDKDAAPAAATKASVEESAAAVPAAEQAVDAAADRLRGLGLPRLFVGATPYLALVALAAVAGVGTWVATGIDQPNVVAIAAAVAATMLVVVGVGLP
jgi:uncharacterized membrane protein YcjF (UPF0283 family)